ncbi:MAG: hypothetical protein GKR93_14820 [Gammaproteobacteria bacterium]|nr:hypothetical protein [Gammaproteobacteria bacterium]
MPLFHFNAKSTIRIEFRSFLLLLFMCFPMALMAASDLSSNSNTCSVESATAFEHVSLVPDTWFNSDRRNAEEYRERIANIETNSGVFAYEMVPELLGLGISSLEQSDLATSSGAFERALYIIRVNDGLYSTKQLAVLDMMIAANSVNEQWKKVAQNYDLMRWLYKRSFTDDDPRQLATLKRLRTWYMESYNKDTGQTLEQLFTSSEEIYEQAIRIMWNCTGGNEADTLCFWHRACCDDSELDRNMCPLKNG